VADDPVASTCEPRPPGPRAPVASFALNTRRHIDVETTVPYK